MASLTPMRLPGLPPEAAAVVQRLYDATIESAGNAFTLRESPGGTYKALVEIAANVRKIPIEMEAGENVDEVAALSFVALDRACPLAPGENITYPADSARPDRDNFICENIVDVRISGLIVRKTARLYRNPL